ncbi:MULTISPECIES: NUDIX hydrolase [unclassified Micromonospora]|uniref:NUDIX domain-containing protein n=1 Tax=unclassified Micromonospora TaxID=2617518 RepID=UPI0015901CE3|nr:NUDIX hydrolase [Verrucosispora sp. NA02020]QKW14842.1 NUDIX hydrolase [Verrucosispora sp. NA02020]
MTWTEPSVWYANLPTFHASAGALITDPAGDVLLVKPRYRDHWAFPGGGVEADEAPHHACAREVHEELGLTLPVGDLLVLDWAPPEGPRLRSLVHFTFDCGTLTGTERLDLPADELTEAAFFPPDEAEKLLPTTVAHRVSAALHARSQRRPIYLPATPPLQRSTV